MTNANEITVKPSQLFEALEATIDEKAPLFVWGPPGVGKSAIVKQAADRAFGEQEGVYFVDVRAMLLDPVDLRGIPQVRDDVTRWFAPCFLPKVGGPAPGGEETFAKKGIVFIDELSQCDPSVQSSLLQLVLDRKLGEYTLPEGWVIIAAGNRISDGTFSKKLSKALGSRFATHVDLSVDLDDWTAWAIDNDVAHEVLAFLRFRPEFLHDFDPKAVGNSFPCPRTWEFASKFVGKLSRNIQLPFLSGLLGHGPAIEFISFMRLYQDLPDINEVVLNPDGAAVPSDPASQYALCGALARKTTAQSANAIFKYMDRLSVEMQVVWLRDTVKISTEVAKTPEFTKWNAKHGDLLF